MDRARISALRRGRFQDFVAARAQREFSNSEGGEGYGAGLIAGKITGSLIDWSPEKPRVFGMTRSTGSSPRHA